MIYLLFFLSFCPFIYGSVIYVISACAYVDVHINVNYTVMKSLPCFIFLCPCCTIKRKQSSAPVPCEFSSAEPLQLEKEDFHTFEQNCEVPVLRKQRAHLFLNWLKWQRELITSDSCSGVMQELGACVSCPFLSSPGSFPRETGLSGVPAGKHMKSRPWKMIIPRVWVVLKEQQDGHLTTVHVKNVGSIWVLIFSILKIYILYWGFFIFWVLIFSICYFLFLIFSIFFLQFLNKKQPSYLKLSYTVCVS